MKILDRIKNLGEDVKNYLRSEIALVRLKTMKRLAYVFGNIFTVIFFLIMINTVFILGGIWLGFFFSSIYGNQVAGFGLAALVVLALLIFLAIFKNTFIINPLIGSILKKIQIDLEKSDEDDEESESNK